VPWKFWSAEPRASTGRAAPGTVVDAGPDGIRIACGEGELLVHELQPPGGRRLAAAAVVAGRRVQAGETFASAAPA
jgi:methionyl-tRNA formyltransferase